MNEPTFDHIRIDANIKVGPAALELSGSSSNASLIRRDLLAAPRKRFDIGDELGVFAPQQNR